MPSDSREAQPFLRKVLDTYNSHRLDAFDALLTEECTLNRDGVEVHGREAVKRVLGQLYRAMPDVEYRIEDAVTSGDKVAMRWEGHGTHRGEYLGISPTGNALSYGGVTFFETRGDRVARIWVTTNLLERLRTSVGAAKIAQASAPA